jgi:hypothetical protein
MAYKKSYRPTAGLLLRCACNGRTIMTPKTNRVVTVEEVFALEEFAASTPGEAVLGQ